MGMFGNIFGKNQQPDPRGMGMGDMGIQSVQAPQQPEFSVAQQASPFDNLPTWKILLGGLFDGLARAGGGQASFIPALEQHRQQQWQMGEMAQQQGLEYQRQLALEQFKADHRKPSEDSFTRALAAAGIQEGSPEYVSLARKRAEMLTNPVQLVPDGMGGYAAVRPNAQPAAQPMTDLPQGYTIRSAAPTAQGNPTVIDRARYQALRASMGPQGVNAWMAKNNVIVGGY